MEMCKKAEKRVFVFVVLVAFRSDFKKNGAFFEVNIYTRGEDIPLRHRKKSQDAEYSSVWIELSYCIWTAYLSLNYSPILKFSLTYTFTVLPYTATVTTILAFNIRALLNHPIIYVLCCIYFVINKQEGKDGFKSLTWATLSDCTNDVFYINILGKSPSLITATFLYRYRSLISDNSCKTILNSVASKVFARCTFMCMGI